MKPSVIAQLLSELEKLVQVEFESGVEFWLARDLQKLSERSSLDCGSLLPLSAMQPAASRTALARKTPDETSACPPRSRLHWGKLQQAVAVQGLRQNTHTRSFSRHQENNRTTHLCN